MDAAVLASTKIKPPKPEHLINLSFSCKDLPNADTFSLSDPFLVLFKFENKIWNKIG